MEDNNIRMAENEEEELKNLEIQWKLIWKKDDEE